MKCKHEMQHLVGTEKGIMCRNCGKQFPNFEALKEDAKQDEEPKKDEVNDVIEDVPKSDPETAIPEVDGEADKVIEKEKKTAVPAKSKTTKGSKNTKTKEVSKK